MLKVSVKDKVSKSMHFIETSAGSCHTLHVICHTCKHFLEITTHVAIVNKK